MFRIVLNGFTFFNSMVTGLFPDYFEPKVMVTVKYKQTMNLRIIKKLHYLLGEMKAKETYLENYWYNLKYMVKALHAIYHLLYKILMKYVSEEMCSKSEYHHLICGPRPIKQNMEIFQELCKFISVQVDLIACQLRYYLSVHLQDNFMRLLFRLSQFMEKVIWYENSLPGLMVNGLPIKLNWI